MNGTVHYNEYNTNGFEVEYISERKINNYYELPAGYTKCVYLQSNGTQWIDTGVIPNADTGVYIKTQQLSYGDHTPMGSWESSSYFYFVPRFNTSSKAGAYSFGTTSQIMFYYDKGDDLVFTSTMNLYNDRTVNFWSEDTNWFGIIPVNFTASFTRPLWLFSYNMDNSTINATYGKFSGRIFRAKITQGDTLIHDYVPCLDADNRPCMYDLITQTPYYNQSGGTEFAYCVEHQLPSDFIKLKYLESNSNLQHIKTGYIPTNNTGMYVDAYNTVVEDKVVMGMQNTTGNDRMWIGGVMKSTHGARYGWGTITAPGGTGDVRFEASLNWLNDKKSIITCPAFAQRVNTLSDLTFTPNQDIYIFGWNRQGSLLHWKGRIYRAKISEGSEIVRDFVPAYDTRKLKPCMYDLINNVAYYNDGEGEFLTNRDFEGTYKGYTGLGCIGNRLGSDYNPINEKLPSGYTRVEFLESTGTQWIKTEVDPHHLSYKIVFDGFNGSGSGLQLFGVQKYTTPNSYWYGTITQTNNNGIGFKTIVPAEEDGNFWLNANDNPIGSRGISEVNFNENYVYIKGALEENKKTCGDYTERILDTHTSCALFARQDGGIKCKARVYSLQGNYNGIEAMNFIPAIDHDGKPCMYDSVRKRTFYKTGTGDFIVGLKTLSNALQLRLPNNGGTIHLSLPTNDKTEIYEEKIRANNPNWTITFQYH